MKDAIYRISLDIHEHGSQAVLKAKKTDTGRMLHITLREGGTPYIIEADCYAVFKATKPDGSILYNACTIERNEIIYEFTEQTCTAVGRCRCEIALYGLDDKLITSPRFALLVDGTIYPEGSVESTDEFSALTQLISGTLEATEAATQAARDAGNSSNIALESANKANLASETAILASENASSAAELAGQAATSAKQAAEAATKSKQDANTAAGEARRAAEDADSAAASANQAAQSANSASINANQAATKAAQTAKSLMVIGKATGTVIGVDDSIEQFLVGCRIFGKTTQDGTPTPDAPVELVSAGDSGKAGVSIAGKNLLDLRTATFSGCSNNGGVLVSNVTNAHYASLFCQGLVDLFMACRGRMVTFSANKCVDGRAMAVVIYGKRKNGEQVQSLNGKIGERFVSIQISDDFENITSVELRWNRSMSGEFTDTTSSITDLQVEIGEAATTYEPHKGQTMTVVTHNVLLGIPVTTGGNYTDANGQQWICDEIDLARGVYVQRIYKLALDTIESWRKTDTDKIFQVTTVIPFDSQWIEGLCTHFRVMKWYNTAFNPYIRMVESGKQIYFEGDLEKYTTVEDWTSFLEEEAENGTPVELQYVLAAPIEIPLSEEEIAAYNALHTYRGNTTVSNDAGAYMELEYVMDAKKYIDSLVAGNLHPATVE